MMRKPLKKMLLSDLPLLWDRDLLQRYNKALSCFRRLSRLDVPYYMDSSLKRVLPGQIIRRLSPSYGRSRSVQPDTARDLFAIVYATERMCIVETGTYWGYTSCWMAASLHELSHDSGATGRIYTIDTYPKAGRLIPKTLRAYVEVIRGCSSTEALPGLFETVKPDMFFHDSDHSYQNVVAELRLVAPVCEIGALVVLHDFNSKDVRQATLDVLSVGHWKIYQIDNDDRAGLGIARKIAK